MIEKSITLAAKIRDVGGEIDFMSTSYNVEGRFYTNVHPVRFCQKSFMIFYIYHE